MTLALALLATLPFFSLPAYAQDPANANNEKPAQKEPTEEEKEIKKYEEKVKDLPKFAGNFILYQRKSEILAEISESQLDQLFCVQATVSTGVGMDGMQAGDPLNADNVDVFKFRKGPQGDIQLIKPNLGFRFDDTLGLKIASQRSIPEAILDNYTIEATHPGKKLILINITDLFHGDTFKLRNAVSGALGSGYSPDRQNFAVNSIRSFPENSVVNYQLHYKKAGGDDEDGFAAFLAALLGISGPPLADSRSFPFSISYNLWFRKETGYMPRLADPRVGYFTTDYFDVAKFNQIDRTTRLIQRYHLVKKDPNAELSEPVEPIIWILDKSIPAEYRQGVRDGILYWNKAYEAIGFKNALIVKDAPDHDDFDPADGRYNTVRWTMTRDQAYAVAWFRPDPITGQILNAGVTVDANYPASAFTEFKEEVVGRSSRQSWLDEDGQSNLLRQNLHKPFHKQGFRKVSCDHAHGLAEQAAFGYNLMGAIGVPVDTKEYVRLMVADLVAHEVGHCLGLRHNFAASTLRTTQELKNYAAIKESGVVASVMDYTPLNLVAILNGHAGYYNPTIGAYDMAAIEYGYKPLGAESTRAEVPKLDAMARRYGSKGLLYLTDEDADGINPLSTRWDLASDAVNYYAVEQKANELLRNFAINKSTLNGQSYTRRNAIILRTLRRELTTAAQAARYIGGIEFRRHLKGDINEQPTLKPVTPAEQRAALKFIGQTALKTSGTNLPQDILFGMSQAPEAGGADYNAPLLAFMTQQLQGIVAQLLSSEKIDAIAENSFKTTGKLDQYTLEEHYTGIINPILAELKSGQAVTPFRRELQRFLITSLVGQVESKPGLYNGDAVLLAGDWLKTLKPQFSVQGAKATDRMTSLHYKSLAEQIDRALEPK
jgi:hypothetical protein